MIRRAILPTATIINQLKFKIMKVYVLIISDLYDYENSVRCFVYKDLEDAKESLHNEREQFLEGNDLEDYKVDESELCFSAWEDGNYSANHFDAWIEEVEVL